MVRHGAELACPAKFSGGVAVGEYVGRSKPGQFRQFSALTPELPELRKLVPAYGFQSHFVHVHHGEILAEIRRSVESRLPFSFVETGR